MQNEDRKRYFITPRDFDGAVVWYVKDRLTPVGCAPYIVAQCRTEHDAGLVRDALNGTASHVLEPRMTPLDAIRATEEFTKSFYTGELGARLMEHRMREAGYAVEELGDKSGGAAADIDGLAEAMQRNIAMMANARCRAIEYTADQEALDEKLAEGPSRRRRLYCATSRRPRRCAPGVRRG